MSKRNPGDRSLTVGIQQSTVGRDSTLWLNIIDPTGGSMAIVAVRSRLSTDTVSEQSRRTKLLRKLLDNWTSRARGMQCRNSTGQWSWLCCLLAFTTKVSAKCLRILTTKFNMKYNHLYRQLRHFARRFYGYGAWREGTVKSSCGPGMRFVL